MPKQYFFEAGTFPDLSYTELVSTFSAFGFPKENITRYGNNIFFVQNSKLTDLAITNIFKRLGGAIRVGEIIKDIDSFYTQSKKEGKLTFGISILGESKRDDSSFLKKLGNGIKKQLKEYRISSRFVLPIRENNALNAAQVIKNEILEKGFELLIIRNKGQEIYGRTIDIQDLEGFVSRDTQRPGSNLEMGTLPPKLARMMVNFTGLSSGTIWDPFCGSGTIPMEAAVLGFNFLASDVDPRAVKDTDSNIKWLSQEGYISDVLYQTFKFDILKPDVEVIKKLRHTDIDAIVCEPFMGPPQTKILSETRANELLNDVKGLYRKLFELIDLKIEKRGIKVVMIVPSYKTRNGWITFGIRDLVGKRWIIRNSEYSSGRDLKWSRKNSIITRNIFILERS